MIKASGLGGRIEFDGERVVIYRKGVFAFLLHGMKGNKTINVSSISAIQFRDAGMLVNGYIQFTFEGGREAKGGVFQATQDENTVMFQAVHQRDFDVLKNAIEKAIQSKRNPSTVQVASVADEIRKLADMKAEGILSDEEFDAQKRRLLSSGTPPVARLESIPSDISVALHEQSSPVKKALDMWPTLGWGLGLLFTAVGLINIFSNFWTGIFLLVAAFLLIPPLYAMTLKAEEGLFSKGLRVCLIIFLFLSALAVSDDNLHADISDNHPTAVAAPAPSNNSKEIVATVINLNGLLCAEVQDVRPLALENQYEVTCIEYRGGGGTVRYTVNAATGTAFKAN